MVSERLWPGWSRSCSLADLTKGYLGWREATITLVEEEADRLGVNSHTRQLAISAIRKRCDSLVRMGRQFNATRRKLMIIRVVAEL